LERVLDTNQVAKAFKVKPKTVRRWIKEGRLPAFRLGGRGRWRIEKSDVDRLREASATPFMG